MFQSLANQLTLSRIVVIPLILALMAIPQGWAAWSAWGLFALAGITDWLDGYVARRDGQVSMMGQFLDPIADKLLVAAVLLLLVYNGHISGFGILPAVIILLRDPVTSRSNAAFLTAIGSTTMVTLYVTTLHPAWLLAAVAALAALRAVLARPTAPA